MGKERRREPRLNAKLFIELESDIEKKGRGVVTDVSLSGFAVETEADLHPDQVLSCHIEIPLYLKAKVVRTLVGGQMKRYGLRFINQSFLEKIVLKKLLKGSLQTRKLVE